MKLLNSLIVITPNGKLYDDMNKAGVWVQGVAVPYFVFEDAGEMITVAFPHGGPIFPDKVSLSSAVASEVPLRFQQDSQAICQLTHSLSINKKEDLKNQISTIV